MAPLLLVPARAVPADDAWSAGDWVLGVVVPLVLLALGVVLHLRGRTALDEATRVRAGFGGPPGSVDVGTEQGFGAEGDQGRVLAAQRLRLWGLLLAGVGLLWLVVTLVVALL